MSLPPSFVALRLEREGSKPLNEPCKWAQRERGYGKLLDVSIAIPGKSEHCDAGER